MLPTRETDSVTLPTGKVSSPPKKPQMATDASVTLTVMLPEDAATGVGARLLRMAALSIKLIAKRIPHYLFLLSFETPEFLSLDTPPFLILSLTVWRQT